MTTLFDHPRWARRGFLQSSVSLAAFAGWKWLSASEASAAVDERPKFSFVQLNDTHVQAPLDRPGVPQVKPTYVRANDKCRWLVEEINRQQVDFVLAVGDMVHGEHVTRLPLDLAEFKSIVAPLGCPLYPNLGNHEVVQQEGKPEFEQPYREVFGDQRVNYTFEQGDLLFVMLNNSGATNVSKEQSARRNAWFRQVLESNPERKKIVTCHIPLISVRDETALAKSFGFKSYRAFDDELLALVDQHAKSIVAVLSGHLHLTGCAVRGGVHHISIAGTASFPADFARFNVYGDRLEMEVHQLPLELATSHPTLHGSPRHQQDITDGAHPTAKEYQIGRADERRLVMPL